MGFDLLFFFRLMTNRSNQFFSFCIVFWIDFTPDALLDAIKSVKDEGRKDVSDCSSLISNCQGLFDMLILLIGIPSRFCPIGLDNSTLVCYAMD